MKVHRRGRDAFTLVEIMIVVTIIGLLAAVAIPNFVRARNTAQRNACITNLRQIDGAKQQWAIENKRGDTDIPTPDDIKVYIKNEQFPSCPGGGSYSVNAVNTDPTCSKAAPPDLHVLPAP